MNKEVDSKLLEFIVAKFFSYAPVRKWHPGIYILSVQFLNLLHICKANAVTRAVTELRKQWNGPNFSLTIRDVETDFTTDKNCENSYFEDKSEGVVLQDSA